MVWYGLYFGLCMRIRCHLMFPNVLFEKKTVSKFSSSGDFVEIFN